MSKKVFFVSLGAIFLITAEMIRKLTDITITLTELNVSAMILNYSLALIFLGIAIGIRENKKEEEPKNEEGKDFEIH